MTDTARAATRTRRDLCPGVLRPWSAEDGALARIRLVGGEITLAQLRRLGQVATAYGDGDLHLTSRANLQLRGLPATDGRLVPEVVAAFTDAGLLPHPTHDLVRNVMVSPLTGLDGGRADLRPVARAFDELLCADPDLARLPGKFLVVLDDGRGDLAGRDLDLGVVAVDAGHAQLRAGSTGWGEVVAIDAVPAHLVELAHAFLAARGTGVDAAWHVDELAAPLLTGPRDPRTEVATGPLPFTAYGAAVHVEVPDGVLTARSLPVLLDLAETDRVVVTPWRGLVLPVR